MQLCAKLEATPQSARASPAAVEEMEAAFGERVKYMPTIDSVYKKARRIIKTLNHSGCLAYDDSNSTRNRGYQCRCFIAAVLATR